MIEKLKAFVTLVRLPNLLFILLTQVITWHALIRPMLHSLQHPMVLQAPWLAVLVVSTVFIAAAGYMINDYFDIGIDMINKPARVTIERVFKRRHVIIWHILLNVVALLMAGYIAWQFVLLRVVLIQFMCILLLLWYSVTLKRKLVVGNLAISLLTALTLLSVAFYEPGFPAFDVSYTPVRLFWMYVIFAFLVTWAREIVKDIEDIKGDGVRDCRTVPLVWGIQAAKNLVYVITGILILLLLMESVLADPGQMALIIYWIAGLCLPLCFLIFKLRQAIHSTHFHYISTLLKWITLAGILSMLMI